MNHIYFRLLLSLFCVLLAYFVLSKLLLVTVFCVILSVICLKNDFIVFRYVATRVASFYLWVCETYGNLQNMYHQSNNTNSPLLKCVENNGTTSNKLDSPRSQHILTNMSHNLNSSYVLEAQPLSSTSWNNSSNISPFRNYSPKITQLTVKDISRIYPSEPKKEISSLNRPNMLANLVYPENVSPNISTTRTLRNEVSSVNSSRHSVNSSSDLMYTSKIDQGSALGPMLYANVNSPGFCSRVAERLCEDATHQSKYDTVGAFPVVNLKNQSPKIKVKPPVRVRLAPPSNDLVYSSVGVNSIMRSPLMKPDESMKSVLQVLKEISRKRIHSHVEEDCEDNSKRLRISESHYDNNGVLQTSLLQQTIQGKRAREESSPNEDDAKKRHKPLQNNEILSSLSSSTSIKPPHLKSNKRKAQALEDSVGITTPSLGKLLKVQQEITPPISITVSSKPTTSPRHENKTDITSQQPPVQPSPVASKIDIDLAGETSHNPTLVTASTSINTPPESDDDEVVSRLLGRMSGQVSQTTQQEIPVRNVFMSTNDLSLSPPKENRLAAMIAVLGGPSEHLETTDTTKQDAVKQPERNIKGKALFLTPDTSKQNKKVTFSDTLTTTKIYEKDQSNDTSSVSQPSLSLLTFGESSSPTTSNHKSNLTNPETASIKPLPSSDGYLDSSTESNSLKQIGHIHASPNLVSSSSQPNVSTNINVKSPNLIPKVPSSSPILVSTAASSPEDSAVGSAAGSNASGSETVKPPLFNFGSNKPLVLSQKESELKQPSPLNSITDKPFSFSAKSEESQSVSSSGRFSSSLTNTVTQKEVSKSTSTFDVSSTPGVKEQNFMFGQKDISTFTSTSESEMGKKPLVNGLAPVANTSSPVIFNTSNGQAPSNKPVFSVFGTNQNGSQTMSTFNFGPSPLFSTSLTTVPKNVPTSANIIPTDSTASSTTASSSSSASQPTQSINMFSNVINSSQTKQSPFGEGIQPSQGPSVFVNKTSQISGAFNTTNGSAQVPPQITSVFGNASSQPSGFVSVTCQSDGELKSASATITTQSSNLFVNKMTTTPNSGSIFGAGGSTTQSNPIFGLSSTPALSQVASPFGIPKSTASQSNTAVFGNSHSTTQTTTTVFGSVSSTSSMQKGTSFLTPSATTLQSASFSSSISNQSSKIAFPSAPSTTPAFGVPSNSTGPTFGNQNTTSATSFGTHSNTISFGSQSNSTASNFANQNNTTPSFGTQNSLSNSQSGFSAPGTFATTASFNQRTDTSNTSEVKPPAFSSSSPFMFGSTAPNKEPVKPFGSVAPFSFSANLQQSNPLVTSPSQPSVTSFGGTSTGFGLNQQTPTFGGAVTQSSAGTFAFSQSTTLQAPSYQFNTVSPLPVPGGGMFSIGSGSTAPRSKTGALRRRHKPT